MTYRLLTGCICLIALLGCSDAPSVIDPNTLVDTSAPVDQICTPSDQLCNGADLFICRPDGSDFTKITCALGCQIDHCKSAECTANSAKCAGPKLAEVCDAQGQPQFVVCDHGCVNGACTDIVCTAGLQFCAPNGTAVQQCSTDGLTIDEVAQCSFGCDAATAVCKPAACDAGEVRCAPDKPLTVERCSEDRTEWDSTTIVCEEKCVGGTCFVSACKPGERRCSANGVEACNSAGTGFVHKESCQWGCLANQGTGEALCALCLPGAYACLDGDVVFCEAPFVPWSLEKDCKEIDTCAGGMCIPVLTLSGPAAAPDTLLLLVEAIADCFLDAKSSAKEKDGCRGLHTPGLGGEITRDNLTDWFCQEQGDTVTADDFSDQAHFDAAKDVLGCGITNLVDVKFKTPGEAVHPGLSQVECLAFEKGDVILDLCEAL